MDKFVEMLLPKVKSNLILIHNEDDDLIRGFILAALDYAMTYQKLERVWRTIPPSTMQAVVILASHWYESRDGSTGGFFADTAPAAVNVKLLFSGFWRSIKRDGIYNFVKIKE